MTAKIKLNAASGGGSFSLQAPSSSANNRVFTLPDIADATMATVNGITMADQWRVNAAFNSQNETLSFNWERNDTDFAQIGTGMSYSSGIWTFPQTGIYHIEFCMAMYYSSDLRYLGGAIQATTNNSSYTNRADGYTACADYTSSAYVGRELTMIFDVTDTSTHKIRFRSDSGATVTYDGSSTSNRTYATFIRLGDT
jgi:hypothetical protein